jgi:hypothetical protein
VIEETVLDGRPTAEPAISSGRDGRLRPRSGPALAVCTTLAIASLPLPATLSYDAWSWVTWGREVLHLDLDTGGGPSWKPLPVLLTTVLAPFGDLAPVLWLVLSRAAGLFAFVLVYRLASRWAGPVAGAVAAVLFALTPDAGPRYFRLVAEGHSEPMSAVLTLLAVERHLEGDHRSALAFGTALALLRPESWPYLIGYAMWLWWRDPTSRRIVGLALLTVPLLWFGVDWLGSGSPLHGAAEAQVASGSTAARVALAAEHAFDSVVWTAWLAAGYAMFTAGRRRDRDLLLVGALALSWSVIVVAMSGAMGYAALTRFFLPAAGLVCVLAGVGVARLVEGRRRAVAALLGAILLAATLPAAGARVTHLDDVADEIYERHELDDSLDRLLDQTGAAAIATCGRIAIERSELARVALAWKLDLPLGDVHPPDLQRRGVVIVLAGGAHEQTLAARPSPQVTRLAGSDRWVAYAIGCPYTGRPAAAPPS